MLLCNVDRPLIRLGVLFGMLSILTLLDASETTTQKNNLQSTTNTTSISTLVSQPTGNQSHTDHQPQTPNSLLKTISSSTEVKPLENTTLGVTTKTLDVADKTNEPTPSPNANLNLTTLEFNGTNTTTNNFEYGMTVRNTTAEPTTEAFTQSSSNNALNLFATTSSEPLYVEQISTLATKEPMHVECQSLRNLDSDVEVVCFQYPEDINCHLLQETIIKQEYLTSLLCNIINNTQCHVTFYSSEVNPKCILWVPTTKAAMEALKKEEISNLKKVPIQMKWEHVSEHVTTWRKITIALVTCGVLLAAFILACYFLSNRESWSPGRQRLGEDPYYTETDSQGNTLVSVSAHGQDKANIGTRENGTGQTATPASTNGHSTKKQTVSDTEL